MLTLTKSLFALMLGFIGATIFGLIIIPFLKKFFKSKRYYFFAFQDYSVNLNVDME